MKVVVPWSDRAPERDQAPGLPTTGMRSPADAPLPCGSPRRLRTRPGSRATAVAALAATLAAALAGCAGTDRSTRPAGPQPLSAAQARAAVARVLPASVDDRPGWAADVVAALTALDVPRLPANLCAVLAVTEQESSYRADPPVANLGTIAGNEIDRRAESAGIPALAVRAALALGSSDGRSYAERIDAVRTERELSELFEEFIGRVPFGGRLLARANPVRTGGPMQVSIAFAERHVRERRYPHAMRGSVRDEVFTRRGGLYFGAAHLLDYEAAYPDMLYRFADFNAGRWASRNAAFQQALAAAAGSTVAPDGDLLPAQPEDAPAGQTQRAVLSMAERLDLTAAEVRRDLAHGDGPGLEATATWQRVFALAEASAHRPLPRAVIPRIKLESPKIRRELTTQWFAQRVQTRYARCLGQMADGPPSTSTTGR